MDADKLIEFITENTTAPYLRNSHREIIELARKADLHCYDTDDALRKAALEFTDLVEPE